MSDGKDQWIVVTDDARTLPAIEILTGRGFITGKSGSGKSNTASVVAEELLDAGFNMLIVDTEGEYFGLKEEYNLLHAGRQEQCDMQLEPGQASEIASLTLEQNMPVILDVSMFDLDTAGEIILEVTESLFELERDLQKPYLMLIEEIQEYLPQSGGKDDLAKLLLRVAKRGRKRGLGLCGISQRPSSVDKDFITQCDWMVWHRLTWENDVKIVKNILGDEISEAVPELENGEAFLMTDWDDQVERVKFREKRTFDAGATPGLDAYDDAGEASSASHQSAGNAAIDDQFNISDSGSSSGIHDTDSTSEPAAGGEAIEEVAEDQMEIESMTEQELRDALREERQRSRILEDEVQELRSIHQELDITTPGEAQIPFAEAHDGPRSDPPSPPNQEQQELDSAASIVLEVGYFIWYVFATLRRRLLTISPPRPGSSVTTTSSEAYPIARGTRHRRSGIILLGVAVVFVIVIIAAFVAWAGFF